MIDFIDLVQSTKEFDQKAELNTIYVGKVVNNLPVNSNTCDPAGRVQVRIVDDNIDLPLEVHPDKSLIWCFPLIPNFIECIPEVGSAVFVFLENIKKPHGKRFYMGPITIGHGSSGDSFENIKGQL